MLHSLFADNCKEFIRVCETCTNGCDRIAASSKYRHRGKWTDRANNREGLSRVEEGEISVTRLPVFESKMDATVEQRTRPIVTQLESSFMSQLLKAVYNNAPRDCTVIMAQTKIR